jgi:7-cyano-7-deazaguanine synthase in queuosine biosynthesis
MTARSIPLRRFAFTRGRLPGTGWERLTDKDFRDKPRRITAAAATSPGPAPMWARDLLELARAAFLVDKRFPREAAPDRWTRRIELHVQLCASDVWTEEACRRLDALLGTMTGDQWQTSVGGGAKPEESGLGLRLHPPVSAVALLSGGLDSACHAARLARSSHEGVLLFVRFVDREQVPQERVLGAIRKLGATVLDRHLDQRPRKGRDGNELELSSRTRGFLYMAAAVHAAAAHGVRRVDVPENGQLAVNPPLTPSRLGALSTRSVHPSTLHQFNELIKSVGGDVELVNPLLHLTKGEVCVRARDDGLTASDLYATVSCGRHTYLGHRNCGSCFPCLVRRSGLLHALGEDRSGYEHEQIPDNESADLRAIRLWLHREFGERDLVADMPWPPDTTPASVLPVLQRGRAELTSMVARLATTVRT